MKVIFSGKTLFRPATFLIIICLASFSLMSWAALTDSAITDEVAHIPAGYVYDHDLSYRLNPEHPPLVKALAAIPLFFLRINPPVLNVKNISSSDEWTIGGHFFYRSGNNANRILQTARFVPIITTIITIIFIYFLSRLFMGEWWSLMPSFLFALDPTILGNGHYVTTDIGASLGLVMATYYFFRYLKKQSSANLWLAGIALGIALLLKFSTFILVPFFLFVAFFYGTKKNRRQSLLKNTFIIFLISLGIVYLVYSLFLINYPMGEQIAAITTAMNSHLSIISGPKTLCLWLAHNQILRPFAEYFLGFFLTLGHVAGGTAVYAFGKVSLGVGWSYFPLIFLLKEPIATLLIITTAAAVGSYLFINKLRLKSLHLPFFISMLFLFILVYWFMCLMSPLDLGIRYLIPTFPFIYILATYFWHLWLTSTNKKWLTVKYIFLGSLLLWFPLETFLTAPYFLSYYNEIGGGTWNGYRWATDSNYDWGQDLLRFQAFMNKHPEITKIAFGSFNQGNVNYYLGNRAIKWTSANGNPAEKGIHWFAISINGLELAIQPTTTKKTRNPRDTYQWLTNLRPPKPGIGNVPSPNYRIGTTIFIYHL